MVSLSDGLAYELHNSLEFLGGASDAGLDKFDLWGDNLPHFRHGRLVFGDIPDRARCVGMFAHQVVLARNGLEYDDEMLCKVRLGHEQR